MKQERRLTGPLTAVDLARNGLLITAGAAYQVNSAAVQYPWDLNTAYALSSSSNTDNGMLAAYYNGSDIVYKHSTGNTMAWRKIPNRPAPAHQMQDKNGVNALTGNEGPLPAGQRYRLYDLSGRLILDGTSGIQAVDLTQVPSGIYLLHTINADGGVSSIRRINKP